ncbi:archaeosortase A [Halovenus rubra]|uniref:Archaeosortase A n=2 Tax=Halovenus rubra TaxID=869890 RepID=A0ABD5X9G5_9EURY|nr:archaeosortase A [Halovenus rubra]
MLGQLNTILADLGTYAHPVGWLALAVFLIGVVVDTTDREHARPVFIAGWLLFALFWVLLIQPFFVADQSIIRGVGAVLAAPLSVLVAKVLYEGRDTLFTLSRAVPMMGLFYVPFSFSQTLREELILLVTGQTAWVMNLIGYNPPLVTELSEAAPAAPGGVDYNLAREIGGKELAFENTFVFFTDGGGTITYTIVLACTGIGSMAVIGGLVLAVKAPLRRKVRGLALALPIIYVLNIIRNVFIGLSYGHQYAHFFPDPTITVFALDNSLRVSYIWADRILAQSGSVIAMVIIFWLVVREVPEVMDPVEEVLYLLTGEELDLAAALNVDRETGESTESTD